MADTSQPARVRFAPSPTGRLHLGSARTALYNYLLARRTGGQFILRIEDTDFKRTVEGAEDELLAGLRWLGLQWDEGPDVGGPYSPYRQSERKETYLKYARQLVERGRAYPCFCTPERLARVRQEQLKRKESLHYDGTCRNIPPEAAARRVADGERHVIRFKAPQEGTTTVHDLLRGDITVDNRNLDDAILVKSTGWALYHLAAIIDDYEMKITHVFRSSEWLGTFPLHALIIRALGWEEPTWVHLSVFLKPGGKGKMSKRDAERARDDGYSIFIKDLEALGYIPEGILNWIVLMGWGTAENDEMSLDEMIARFDLAHLNPAPAAVDFKKLDHFNGLHIRRLSVDDLAARMKPFFIEAGYPVDDDKLRQIAPLLQPRLKTLRDAPIVGGVFFEETVSPNPEELIGKKMTAPDSAEAARRAVSILSGLTEITHETAEPPMRALAGELGLKAGQLFGILRVAVTGRKVSPPLFETMDIIGRDEVLRRVEQAVALLESLDS